MSDNFWFNDNEFMGSSNQSGMNDDFLNSIFDQNQGQGPSLNAQGSPEPAPSDTLNPQLFMKQQAPQQQAPQKTPQEQSLDNNKKEQLMRMRHQIMQQQMLHSKQLQQGQTAQQPQPQPQPSQQQQQKPMAQQQYQGGNSMNNNINPQAQLQANMRMKNMEMDQMSLRSQVPTPGAQSHQMYGSPANMIPGSDFAMPQQQNQNNQQNMQQQPPNMQQNIPPAQQNIPPPNKIPQAQLAQLQMELFLVTLYDFMSRRGTPISQPPTVNKKRVNLFLLYMLSQKLGGPPQLIKSLQNPNYSAQSPWSVMAQRLGLYDGINVQDPSAKMQIEKDLRQCYLQYIIPYEQQNSTPEGQRDLQQRKAKFQKQILLRFQQQQQQNQSGQTPQSNSPSVPMPTNPQMNQLNSPQTNSPMVPNHMSPPQISGNSPYGQQPVQPSPLIPNSMEGPGQIQPRKVSRASNPSASNSPNIVQSPYLQQNKPGSRALSVANRPLSKSPALVASPFPADSGEPKDPNIIKKFVPMRKHLETYGALDIKSVSTIASEIEITKPVYLFAPELGSINVQALIMLLKNNTICDNTEILSALNTLLVTTSDSSFVFDITHCFEMLDALSILGSKVLDRIVHGKKTSEEDPWENADEFSQNSRVDEIFNRYVDKRDLQDENIVMIADSLTGQLVENDDSDMLLDDIFSPVQELLDEESNSDMEEDKEETKFVVTDYIKTLNGFREENKYHFSKIQTKSATNEQVLLVDELITISMILRNIAFSGTNREKMSSNDVFLEFLFSLVKKVFQYPEAFINHRKRLCVLKDSLLLLYNISYTLNLRSLEDAFLAFTLVTAFGPDLTGGKKIVEANVERYSYLPYGVDILTKLLVREPHNRSFMKAVLTGTLSVSLNSVKVSDEDVAQTRRLADSYLQDSTLLEKGELLTRCFKLFMSVIPYASNTFDFLKFANIRTSTLIQAYFGAKLIIDFIVPEEDNHLRTLTTEWLLENSNLLLKIHLKTVLSLVPESAKSKFIVLVVSKGIKVSNTLMAHALTILESERDDPIKEEIKRIVEIPGLMPDWEISLETLCNPTVDTNGSMEITRFVGLRYRMQKYFQLVHTNGINCPIR